MGLGPDTAVQTDDAGLVDHASAHELVIHVRLPGHD
jgi:hypothetical protein